MRGRGLSELLQCLFSEINFTRNQLTLLGVPSKCVQELCVQELYMQELGVQELGVQAIMCAGDSVCRRCRKLAVPFVIKGKAINMLALSATTGKISRTNAVLVIS